MRRNPTVEGPSVAALCTVAANQQTNVSKFLAISLQYVRTSEFLGGERMEERRRSSRHRLAFERADFASLASSVPVQVLDMSIAGVLLQASRPITVGTHGRLRLSLSGRSFATEVATTRLSPVDDGAESDYRIGATFTAISPNDRETIERFTNQQLRRP